jgi:two-component system, response regulator RpfG
VADVFDALTSDRPYRGALSRDVALAHLIGEAGRTLDADVVAALLGLVHLDAGDAA